MSTILVVCKCGRENYADARWFKCVTGGWHDGFKQCQGCVKRQMATLTFVDVEHRKRLCAIASGAIQRCTREDLATWERYGGRGIKVHQAWLVDISEFVKYLLTLPNNNDQAFEIDRIDNNGNYEPGNLRFVTPPREPY